MPNVTQNSPKTQTIQLIILLVLLAIIGYLGWLISPKITRTSNPPIVSLPSPSPTKGPVLTLPPGPQTYKFSNGSKVVGPKVSSVTIDPLTPSGSASQTLTLSAVHTSPITSVTIEVITDSKTDKHILTQKSGTNTDGTWEASWQIDDTYDYKYGLRLILASSEGTYDNIMWFRH